MDTKSITRQEMIEILIEDRMWDWVYARNYDGLKEMLTIGFDGFEKYTDEELKNALEDLDEETIIEIKKC